jgi:hypothetical protein
MEKGYKLKLNDKWMAIRRFYGEYIFSLYDDDNNENVRDKVSYDVAKRLKLLTKNTEYYDEIQIVYCGYLTESETKITINDILKKRIIR